MQPRSSCALVALLLIGAGCGATPTTDAATPAATDAPPPPATPEPTANDQVDAQGIHHETVHYEVGGKPHVGYLAYRADQKKPRPGIVVVHEWWGQNAYARRRTHMLAELGYSAFALDMFGEGKVAEHPDDAKRYAGEALADPAITRQRFEAGLELLKAHPTTDPTLTGAVGYCFGGGVVLQMARAGADLDVAISFHGVLTTKTPAPVGMNTDLLVLHGALDPLVPFEQVEAFKQEMRDAKANLVFVAYGGAKHAFTNPDATRVGQEFGLPVAYHEEADHKSWAELEHFLEAHFPRPEPPADDPDEAPSGS